MCYNQLPRFTICCSVLSSLHRRFLLLKIPGIVDLIYSTALFIFCYYNASTVICKSCIRFSWFLHYFGALHGGDGSHDLLIIEGAQFQDVEEMQNCDHLDGCYTQMLLQGIG